MEKQPANPITSLIEKQQCERTGHEAVPVSKLMPSRPIEKIDLLIIDEIAVLLNELPAEGLMLHLVAPDVDAAQVQMGRIFEQTPV